MKWVVQPWVVVTILASFAAPVAADIFRWTDEAGVEHYTNVKSEVPAPAQASVQLVVDETARQQQEADGPAVPEAPQSKAARRPSAPPPVAAAPVESISERLLWMSGYLDGLQRGLAFGGTAAPGGGVQINTPLIVGGSGTGFDNSWPYFWSPYHLCASASGWPCFSTYAWPPFFYPGVAVVQGGHLRFHGRLHGQRQTGRVGRHFRF
jgi:hypothetical protein